ncbi:MAG: hypothetical protein J6K72_10950 [Clostridia bacterium]|nr:hypothetical protein [Clostridia bacterium]
MLALYQGAGSARSSVLSLLSQIERNKEKPLTFLFVSKRKVSKRKTTIDWTVAGGGVPYEVQLQATVHQSNKKRKPAFHPSTRVEAGFLLLLFFSLKRKEESFFFGTFFFSEKESTPRIRLTCTARRSSRP